MKRPEPERELTVHIDAFRNCRSKMEADFLLLHKLQEAGFRLNERGDPEEDFYCTTSASGQTITIEQWPRGTIRAYEARLKNVKV